MKKIKNKSEPKKILKKMYVGIGMLWREILKLVYPMHCPVCDEIVRPGELICPECEGKIRMASEPVCKRCGKVLSDERKEYCTDCGKIQHSFEQGKAVFVYEGAMRQSMYRFKYSNKREYAEFFTQRTLLMYEGWIRRMGVEVIVPIPMYRGKVRRRGYNQAEVFAKALGRELNLPVETALVARMRDTRPQKELNDRQRRQNLKNAFQFTSNIVKYSRILLVDDIYTTGSTMDAVADVLLSAGVDKVYYICISIGVGY